jgi:hypothetical protein
MFTETACRRMDRPGKHFDDVNLGPAWCGAFFFGRYIIHAANARSPELASVTDYFDSSSTMIVAMLWTNRPPALSPGVTITPRTAGPRRARTVRARLTLATGSPLKTDTGVGRRIGCEKGSYRDQKPLHRARGTPGPNRSNKKAKAATNNSCYKPPWEKAMADDDMKAELERLRKENAALKKGTSSNVRMKVSEKGALSVYGMGRFPVTLYKEQWLKLLGMADDIRAFIADNDSQLKAKE